MNLNSLQYSGLNFCSYLIRFTVFERRGVPSTSAIVCCLQRNAAHGTQGLCCYLTVPTHLAQAWPPQQNRIAKRHTALCRIARRNAGIRLFTAGSIDALQELSTVYRARKSVCRKIVKNHSRSYSRKIDLKNGRLPLKSEVLAGLLTFVKSYERIQTGMLCLIHSVVKICIGQKQITFKLSSDCFPV